MKWILKIPPHLAYVATLPCETLMSAKQVMNAKLQGSVATYLRFALPDPLAGFKRAYFLPSLLREGRGGRT